MYIFNIKQNCEHRPFTIASFIGDSYEIDETYLNIKQDKLVVSIIHIDTITNISQLEKSSSSQGTFTEHIDLFVKGK